MDLRRRYTLPPQSDSAYSVRSYVQGWRAFFSTHHRHIVDLAAKHRLPAIDPFRVHADAGELMAYGPSHADLWRHAVTYVDKILKRTKSADLPVEQPMTFEIVINLKTAKDVGLTIPPGLLFQATEVIR
jgi:putative tryptophan/tyrosine transport system substrate-binding protein